MAKFSAMDAERLPEYERRLEAVADVLRGLILTTPPNVTDGGWAAAILEMLKAASAGRRVAGLHMAARLWGYTCADRAPTRAGA